MKRFGRAGTALALLTGIGLAAAVTGARHVAGRAHTPAALHSATEVELVMPEGADTLLSVTPTFIVRVKDPLPADRPIQLGLQISFTPGFTVPLVLDTVVIGDTADIALARPLPAESTIYVRATARTAPGELVVSAAERREVPTWLALISPNDPTGATLETQRPRFVWRSAPVGAPPGPWLYDLQIRNVGSGTVRFFSGLTDTTFIPAAPLEFNTSYRWSVTARLATGESATAASLSSFVVINPAVPLVTLLYQNFPNPFPSATSSSTCIWFDLASDGRVSIDVFDISGRHVVNIVPGRTGLARYPAGRHGRAPIGASPAGCNGDVQWDGRGSDGDVVPAGVYLLRLRAGSIESVKKMVFRGRT